MPARFSCPLESGHGGLERPRHCKLVIRGPGLHSHHHGARMGKVLKWSLAATVAFIAIETLAGFEAKSLALLSDAGHNFTDALALLLAWFGYYLESKPADEV